MCGRLCCTLDPLGLCKACSYSTGTGDYTEPYYIQTPYQYAPGCNICPSMVVPVLTHKNNIPDQTSGLNTDLIIIPMYWGFLPAHQDSSLNSSYKRHNQHTAGIEFIRSSNFLIEGTRDCVILCEGYFEWQTIGDRKQPYYIYPENMPPTASDTVASPRDWLSEKPLLKLAGVFETHTQPDGTLRHNCRVITTKADKRLWMHNRMPHILETFDDVNSWIDSTHTHPMDGTSVRSRTMGHKINQKYFLKYHAVDQKYVNSTKCQSRLCIDPKSVKRQATLENWLVRGSPKKCTT